MKRLLLSLVCVLGLLGGLRAQETISIGSGTSNGYRTPINTDQPYSISQQIYSSSEIGKESGKISKIAFRWASSTAETRNLSIYMQNTTQSSMGGFVPMTDSDKVFDGQVDINTEWVEITFTSKFNYTGGNVLLCVYDKTGSWGVQSKFYNYATSATAVSAQGSGAYDPANLSGGTVRNFNNQIQLTFAAEDAEEIKPNAPANLKAEVLSDTEIQLTWDAVENAAIYTVYQNDVEIKTALQETTFTVEGLTPGTNYCFTVTATADLESDKSNEECVETELRFTTFAFDFNDGIAEMRVFKGAESTSHNWASPKDFPFADMVEGVKNYYKGVDGTMAVYSLTYDTFEDKTYTPDNYIVTEKPYLITETSTIEWDIRQAEEGKTDQYSIVVSEDGTNFTDVWFERYSDKTGATKAYSLAAYAGKEIYIGFRHYKKTNGGALCLDNVKLVTDSQLTPETPVDPTAPTIPDGLKAIAFSESTIKLTWNASENTLSYNIYKGEDVVATSVTETSYMVEGLEAGTNYCFTVTAVNGDKESAKSSEVCATTFEAKPEAPAAPSNLKAEALTESTIKLTWDAVEGAKIYNVYQGDVKLLSVSETTHIATSLQAGREYCFTVTAVNDGGESAESEEACATTLVEEGVEKPATPQNFTMKALVKNELQLSWDAVEGATEYNIYEGEEVIATVSVTNVDLADLESGKEYCFSVTAVNDGGESDKTEEVCETTLGDEPEVPGEGVEENTASFNVYPNPVNDILYIEAETEIEEVVVYDVYGRVQNLRNSETQKLRNSIDVTNLNSGVYFVKVVAENGETVKRIIKD